MHNNLDFELIVAREKRRDLLYQAEHNRLIRLAKKGRKSGVKAGHRSWDSLSIRGMCTKLSRKPSSEKVNASKAVSQVY